MHVISSTWRFPLDDATRDLRFTYPETPNYVPVITGDGDGMARHDLPSKLATSVLYCLAITMYAYLVTVDLRISLVVDTSSIDTYQNPLIAIGIAQLEA